MIVTGGAGFIGSHMVDLLLEEGRRVIVVDDLSTGEAARVDSRAELETIDIADSDALGRLVDAARPDAIYHLAAQASVTRSVTDPRRDGIVNVLGTLTILDAAASARAPVVFTSTGGALYGDDVEIPTTEDVPPAPLSPYGASKVAAEGYTLAWSRRLGVPHAVMRLANIYGPRQNPHGEAGVVAIFSRQLWSGEAPTVYGFGRATRDYVHVADVVRSLRLAEGLEGVYNIATGRETDVDTVLSHLQRAAGTELKAVRAPLRDGELERSCLDPARARRELGWEAEIDVADGLRQTYEALVAEFER